MVKCYVFLQQDFQPLSCFGFKSYLVYEIGAVYLPQSEE